LVASCSVAVQLSAEAVYTGGVSGTTLAAIPPTPIASDRRLLGARLREARKRRGLGVRELSRQTDCSASLISQIELGKIAPSVSTLYVLTSSLGVSMDSLFVADEGSPERSGGGGASAAEPLAEGAAAEGVAAEGAAAEGAAAEGAVAEEPLAEGLATESPAGDGARTDASQAGASQAGASQAGASQAGASQAGGFAPAAAGASASAAALASAEANVVQRGHARPHISLQHGVRWERLNPLPEPGTEFLEVTYAVGGGSQPDDQAIRHNGREYGLVLEGVLTVQIGFESYILQPGDSVAFDSTIPHRFWNSGDVPVRAVWFELKQDGPVATPRELSAPAHGWQ
jgi:transcriptional regulator with XRE-family HTH domain/quercetin dioxygenase-like cupin family protein